MRKVIIKTEYITLGQFLKFEDIIQNGSEAKEFLLKNQVLVNEEVETRRGRKLYDDYKVKIKNEEFLVKRE